MEKEKFSERFKLTGEQKDFDFVDIKLWTDQAFFIDPSLIVKAQHEETKKGFDEAAYATRAHKALQSFFSRFFDEFKDINPTELVNFAGTGAKGIEREEKILDLLKYSSENDALHFGLTKKESKGTGCSPEMIYDFFANMKFKHSYMFDYIREPFHVTGFIDEIGKDRSTDLTVSIILDVLCDYTLSVCREYGIEQSQPEKMGDFEQYRHYWNSNEEKWETRDYKLPIDEYGKPIILVPKSFVTKDFKYNAEYIMSQYILKDKKKEHIIKNPSIEWKDSEERKKIRAEFDGFSVKGIVLEYFKKYPELYGRFMEQLNHGILGTHRGLLTDGEIEKETNMPIEDGEN
ncbi:TPA: hypothetical protein ACSKR0_002829 [Listeria monocytogenes]